MKPLARWTIGNTTPNGYESLVCSILAFTNLYDVEVIVCHNCDPNNLPDRVSQYLKYDQRQCRLGDNIEAKGVAWKLYPPRLAIDRHEIQIDNDLIIEERIPEIDQFLNSDCTLLLQGSSRTYGRFERHVPIGFQINSGIFGMPPGFNFQQHIETHIGSGWEKNAYGEHAQNETFDEQGLVALALLNYPRYVIIPRSCIVDCEQNWHQAKGYHFIGLNRREFHRPFSLYQCRNIKFFL